MGDLGLRNPSSFGSFDKLFEDLLLIKSMAVYLGLVIGGIVDHDLGGHLSDVILGGGSHSGTEKIHILIVKLQCGQL